MSEIVYAAYPSAYVYEKPDGKVVSHELWGDWVFKTGIEDGNWMEVKVRGKRKVKDKFLTRSGWMKKEVDGKPTTQPNKLLEIYFVDIGQGDGCMVITPDDKFMLIDAGEGDNMYRFLNYKFNRKKFKDPINFPVAIITHPDSDHYAGFRRLFEDKFFETAELKHKQLQFGTVFHNGIVERAGADILGDAVKNGGIWYLTDVIADRIALDTIITDDNKVQEKAYPNILRNAAESGRIKDFRMLCSEDKTLNYRTDGKPPAVNIIVLAPVPEKDADGKRILRRFPETDKSDNGKTKNGHSIVLKLEYGKARILLGGDLNIPAENYLLKHYTDINPETANDAEKELLVKKARQVFEADVTKACHHGSADFSSLFLKSINALATIVSSGDDESHAHPRPDALGAFGKHGRGERPLIFSTELARSAKENIKSPQAIKDEIKKLIELHKQAVSETVKKKIEKMQAELFKKLERTVSVYGLINLRTDGEKIVIAQSLESPRVIKNITQEWDIHRLEYDEHDKEFHYVSKH